MSSVAHRRQTARRSGQAIALLAIFAILPIATQVRAQIAEHLFQVAIDKFGGGCQSITRTRPLGSVSGGNALVAAECANGGKHVLMIYPDNTVSYMSTCATFKEKTGSSCFSRK